MFTEVQKFSKWWMFIIGATTIFPVAILIKEDISLQSLLGDNLGLLIVIALQIVLTVGFGLFKLTVNVTDEGVEFRFFPFFVQKSFTWDEVKDARVLDYGFVGGWGIRLWTRYGTVYNTRGNKGVEFHLTNGKHFLIGTQRPDEWKRLLETHWG